MIILCSIAFIVLEVFLVVIYGYLSYKNKSFISRNMSWYIIPVAILGFFVLSLGYVYTEKSYGFNGVSICVEYTAKLFIYSINTDHIKGLLWENMVYTVCYFGIMILTFATSAGTILGLCWHGMLNFFHTSYRKLKGTDIIVGYGTKSVQYAKNTRNSILWITSPLKANKDFVLRELYISKIPYVQCGIHKRSIKSFIWRKHKNYNFIFFKEDEPLEYSIYIDLFKTCKLKNTNVKVYFEGNNNEITYLNDLLSKEYEGVSQDGLKCPIMYCFDLYEKIARKFNWEHTIAEYLPEGFILSDGTVANNKKINVIYLGYGKINSALFKIMLMNNQFVAYKGNHFSAKLVNYYLFDKNLDKFNDYTIRRLEEEYYCENNQDKFAKMEKLCELNYKAKNIMSDELLKDISNILHQDNAFTMIFVGYAEDLDNIEFSKLLLHKFSRCNLKVFANVDSNSNEIKHEDKVIQTYGLKKVIFSHEGIVGDELLNLAKVRNENYNILSNKLEDNWAKLSYIKKYSNLYSVLSLRFKLNLMGLDLTNHYNSNCKQLYNAVYAMPENMNDYSQYFMHNLRCTIGFSEHLRWCAFYYLNGYDHLPHEECYRKIKVVEEKEELEVVTKDEKNKFHACLLSFKGVDDLHHYLMDSFPDVYEDISEVDTFKYDYELCDKLLIDLEKLKKSIYEHGIEKLK